MEFLWIILAAVVGIAIGVAAGYMYRKDVAEKKMDRTVYHLMGTWETDKGYTFIFREDGTCNIDGREYYYNATVYGLSIGDREDELTYTYNVMRLTEKNATLLHEKKNTYYRLTRVTEE